MVDVACCPPNVAKLLGLLPSLVFSTECSTIAIHLYLGSTITTNIEGNEAVVKIDTNFPWEGSVKLKIQSQSAIMLAVRIPSWAAKGYTSSMQCQVQDGYLYLSCNLGSVDLYFSTTPRFAYAHRSTRKDEAAVMRGPLVYCCESIDNNLDLETTYVRAADIEETARSEISGVKGVLMLALHGKVKSVRDFGEAIYSDEPPKWNQEASRSFFCLIFSA